MALRVTGVLKPPHHDKVEAPMRRDILYSSVNYHQEHVLRSATEPSRPHTNVTAACGAVMLRFHGVFNPCEVLICGYLHRLCYGAV